MTEIIGKITSIPDVKRFYLPGITIRDNCPNCNAEVVRDMDNHYLSYPDIGKPEEINMLCDCGEEWQIPVILEINIKLA